MSDTFVPAIPSRATGELKPLEPMFDEPLPKRSRKPAKRKPVKKAKRSREGTPATKSWRKRHSVKLPSRKAAVTKNPNRPLERKNQLNAVLAYAASGVPSAEIHTFAAIAATLDKMTKPARQRVLSALSVVYA
ncbi:MAG: hypothetical protein KGL35_24735 [Bradyrhizobium sp.]|nr:hypothetical protein [Bradyrhizobium sp.]